MTRRPIVDVAAIKREVLASEAEEREALANRHLEGVETAVLAAMITRYDFELFADVEVDDFYAIPNKYVFGALRALEAAGKHCDGEFLIADIGAELARVDADQDKHLRDRITDDFLHALVRETKRGEPGSHVVPARDRTSIGHAIATLKMQTQCRREHASPLDVLDCITRQWRRT